MMYENSETNEISPEENGGEEETNEENNGEITPSKNPEPDEIEPSDETLVLDEKVADTE